MRKVILVAILGSVSVLGNFPEKGKPDIPDEFFTHEMHRFGDVLKGPIPEKILPKFKGNIFTGKALLERHREKLQRFIGTNILGDWDKGAENKGNHYYNDDNDRDTDSATSIMNKYKKWYRQPIYPQPKGRPIPPPFPKGTTTTRSETTRIVGTTTATATTTVLPQSPCDFTGIFTFIDDAGNTGEIHTCENNGEYYFASRLDNRATWIARGTGTDAETDGQSVNLTRLQLIERTSGEACHTLDNILFTCDDTGAVPIYQLRTLELELTKIENNTEPQLCYQSGGNTFDNIAEPIEFSNTDLLHILHSDTNTQIACFEGSVSAPEQQCVYDNISDQFSNTVRVSCCGDASGISASFITPLNVTTGVGVIALESAFVESTYLLVPNTTRECAL